MVSIVGTMMSHTALFWLVLRITHGSAAALAAVDAAQCLPMLLFSRRAGTIVAQHRAARIAMVTQALEAGGSLAIAIPLLAGWMSIWYLVPLCFVTGCAAVAAIASAVGPRWALAGPGLVIAASAAALAAWTTSHRTASA